MNTIAIEIGIGIEIDEKQMTSILIARLSARRQ